MKPERIRFHDANLRPAWLKLLGKVATLNERVISLCVAIGETLAGDAWPGEDGIVGTDDDERNKGATNRRKLNLDERTVIAAKGRELLARPDIPQRVMVGKTDRLEFTAVGENGKPMRFRWLITDPATGKQTAHALTPLEAEALKPLTPTVAKGHEARAKAVNQLLAAELPTSPAGLEPTDGKQGVIHCDSHPGLGPFFVWFAAFRDPDKPNEIDELESWVYYLGILTRSAEERAALAAGDPGAMARAMYRQGYFGGFHEKDKDYVQPDGSIVKGAELNIRDYTKVIARQVPSVRGALAAAAANTLP